MSKDIRSFFKITATKKKEENIAQNPAPKRKAGSLNSSDEDKKKPTEPKKQRRIVDSDDEDEKPKVKANGKSKKSPVKNTKKLVEVDVFNMFGSEPVKRKERPKALKPSPNASTEVIDLDGDEDLELLNASIIAEELVKQDEAKKSSKKSSPEKKQRDTSNSPPRKELKLAKMSSLNRVSSNKESAVKDEKVSHEAPSPSPSKRAKKELTSSKKEPTSPKKEPTSSKKEPTSPKIEPTSSKKEPTSSKKERKPKEPKETTVEEDEARNERKQVAIAMYHKFKNRASVINHGCKEIPKGTPDCLKGLQFVISGVLESMERDEAADLIKSCGGAVVSALSKKVTHMLIGEEAGPAKLAKAESMGIKQVTEDELLSIIRKKSGLPDATSIKEEVEQIKKDSPGKENRVKNEDVHFKKELKSPEKKKPTATSTVTSKQVAAEPSNSSSQPPKPIAEDTNEYSFVDKYKPTSMKQIIGQQGPTGNAQKLMNWLSRWHLNHDGKTKHAKPNPWAKDNDGRAFKAALLSGSPGVGKTTTAHLVCKELMFDIVEFNASDTRSKRLLKEEVSALISNNSLAGYLNGSETKVSKRHVLIMDEVDGMAGNEDRGGVAELIALIKESHIPVICMCNDRNHQKIRSLSNHCFDLRFNKPSAMQIRGAMMSICFKEGIKLETGALDEIIGGTGNDIRQTLNHLALYSASKDVKLGVNDAKKNAQMSEKDIKIGQFEVIRKVFSADEHKKMNFNDKCDLFFNDYNMSPLFVQENYLHVKPICDKSQVMKRVALAADSLSLGDLVERRIRSSMAWSLLPTQAIFSSVLPGEYMEGSLTSAVNFPGWLGKNSRSNKRKRMAQEIHDHTRIATSGSRLAVRLDYAQFLIQAIVNPLKEHGAEGVPQALEIIKEYRLLREDIDSLLEITNWPKMKSPWDSVDSRVKAALTRAYNKEVQPYSFSAQAGVKKKAARSAESEDIEGYENEDDAGPPSDEEEDESVDNIAMVKVKKPTAAKAGSSPVASSSKAKAKAKK